MYLIDYVMGMIMWTLIGRAAMNIFQREDSTFFFMRVFVKYTNPIIKLFKPIEGEYVLEGYIESSNEQDIKLVINSVEVVINFSNIKSAKIEFKQFKEKVKG